MQLRVMMRRCAGALALVALLLQLVSFFGHVHARDFAYRDASEPQTASGRSGSGTQLTADNPSKLADDDDQCPICFSNSLLAASFIPDAPQPAIPFDARHGALVIARADHVAGIARRASFQPRAPPAG
jgi:hypothetical protein